MRILVTGASGSGTSTLAAAVASTTGGVHLDADAYYWLPTTTPFQARRDTAERLARLTADLAACGTAVVSGSVVGWGAAVEDAFDLIVFLTLATAIRVERLRARELRVLGRVDPAFIDWAAQYDEGPPVGRSLARHHAWLASRRCPVLALDGDLTVQARLDAVRQALRELPAALALPSPGAPPPR
jgi:hypothetical protein